MKKPISHRLSMANSRINMLENRIAQIERELSGKTKKDYIQFRLGMKIFDSSFRYNDMKGMLVFVPDAEESK